MQSRFPLQVLACCASKTSQHPSCGLSIAIGAKLVTSLRRYLCMFGIALQSQSIIFETLNLQQAIKIIEF